MASHLCGRLSVARHPFLNLLPGTAQKVAWAWAATRSLTQRTPVWHAGDGVIYVHISADHHHRTCCSFGCWHDMGRGRYGQASNDAIASLAYETQARILVHRRAPRGAHYHWTPLSATRETAIGPTHAPIPHSPRHYVIQYTRTNTAFAFSLFTGTLNLLRD